MKAPSIGWQVTAFLLVVVAGHLSLFPRVADLDAFYHVGHTAAYLEGSVFDVSLPWATMSIIGERGGDLWWGYHVLLLPLAAAFEPLTAIRVGALLSTLVLGLTAAWVFRRHGVPHAMLWAAGLLIAIPNLGYRFLMLRPHVLTLAASLALLAVLARGRWWHVLLLSASIAWLHLSLFWIAPGLVVAFSLVRLPIGIASGPNPDDRSVPLGAALAAAFGGVLIGWLLRPEPLATISLLNVQLVRLFMEQAGGDPLQFAVEVFPIGVGELVRTSWLFLLGWIAALVVTVRAIRDGILVELGEERTTLLITTAVVSIAFFGLALLSARRAMEQWLLFGYTAIPFVSLLGREWWQGAAGRSRRIAGVAVAVLLVGHVAWGAWRHSLNVRLAAFDARSLIQAAEYLEEASRPGEVVFHARWDNFGPLFAYNRHNHYLGGMDPIFHFAFDQRSYWEYFYLSADITQEMTCDALPCEGGRPTDTYTAIRDHFGSRWIVVEPYRNPRFSLFLLNDPRFEVAFEAPSAVVFERLEFGAGG